MEKKKSQPQYIRYITLILLVGTLYYALYFYLPTVKEVKNNRSASPATLEQPQQQQPEVATPIADPPKQVSFKKEEVETVPEPPTPTEAETAAPTPKPTPPETEQPDAPIPLGKLTAAATSVYYLPAANVEVKSASSPPAVTEKVADTVRLSSTPPPDRTTKTKTGIPDHCMSKLEPMRRRIKKIREIGQRIRNGTTFLLKHCPEAISPTARRVYIDLGAREYDSSIGFFQSYYPESSSFEYHAFEVDANYLAAQQYRDNPRVATYNAAAWSSYGCIQMQVVGGYAGSAHETKFVQSNGTTPLSPAECEQIIPRRPGAIGPVPTYDIAHWMEHTLRLTPSNSFVILKIDIEGGEWDVLRRLVKTGAIRLVKELMVECHYIGHGPAFAHLSIHDCHNLVLELRSRWNVYAHEWY
eukprot:PhM_4_TR9111/c0_g1_i1/m.30750